MATRTDILSLERLALRSGAGRRLDLHVGIDDFSFGGSRYSVSPDHVPVRLDISRMTGGGYALRLRFSAKVHGPCMRCLEQAEPVYDVDVREVQHPGGGVDVVSPYVDEAGDLDLAAWSRDALALTIPDQILCTPQCAGLCTVCGENLNTAGPEHTHEREPDPRWAALRDLKLD
jgi:uncharacterized protein